MIKNPDRCEKVIAELRSMSSDELRYVVAFLSNDSHITNFPKSTMGSMHTAYTVARNEQPDDIRNF
jgi:hypothetical protein